MTPEQEEALRALSKLFPDKCLYMVGATSLVVLGKLSPDRVTLDLDLAVDVLLAELRQTLAASEDWTPDPRHEERWLHRGKAPVDLLAIGGVHLEDGVLVWPDTGARMNLAGFELLADHSVAQHSRGLSNVLVPVLEVVAVLKMASWLDRPHERLRDLRDLAHLMDRYLEPLDDRMFVGEAAQRGLFGEEAAAYLLGIDIARLGKPAAAALLARFVERLRGHPPSLVALVQRWPLVADEDEALRRLELLEQGLAAGASG